MAARLAALAQHAGTVRLTAVLSFASSIAALVLAVTLYAITRDQDRDIARLGMVCRVAEGVVGAGSITATLALLKVGTDGGAQAVGTLVLEQSPIVAAMFFAVGSTCFSWLLLRGRLIPVGLAWLGVVASVLVVVEQPLELAGLVRGPITQLIWLPMAAFEVPLGIWWIIKGVREAP